MYGLAMLKQKEKEQARHDPAEHQPVRGDRTMRTRPPTSSFPTTIWWYWYGSETEAMGYYLKLLSRTDAKGQIAPRWPST